MNDQPLINEILPNTSHLIDEWFKANDSITMSTQWSSNLLTKYIAKEIINKIIAILILITNTEYKITSNLLLMGSSQTITWTNNTQIHPYLRAKLLNNIWRLNLVPRIKMFALKLIRQKLNTQSRLKKLGIDINGGFPFGIDINGDYLFKNHVLVKTVSETVYTLCPSLNAGIAPLWIGLIKFGILKCGITNFSRNLFKKMFALLELFET